MQEARIGGATPVDERTQPSSDAGRGGGSGGGVGARDGGPGTTEVPPKDAPATTETPVADPSARPANPTEKADDESTAKTPGTNTPAGREEGARQAVGGVDGRAVGDAATKTNEAPKPEGATAAETKKASDAVEASETPSAPDANAPEAAAKSKRASDIELPEIDLGELEADESVVARAGDAARVSSDPLAGIWEQQEGGSEADFGPGGYERSVIMLNPATGIAAVYRSFRGSISLVMGGELAIAVKLDADSGRRGTLTLRTDPSLSSRFPTKPMALGGTPPRSTVPPAGESPWTLPWSREGGSLRIGGKLYRPITRERFEEVRRGGGDVASAEELAETAPVRPVGKSGGGGGAEQPRETAFFGVVGGGKRFVFIVDVSGSMQGSKLDRMKAELEKSVAALPADVDFSIVFFAGGAEVIDQTWMQAGRDTQRAIGAIRMQGCLGGTDPTEAFQFAFTTLSPIPDCIFFMTDGQIPPYTPDLVRQLNSGRVPTVIHTIGFGSPAEEPAIRPLLEQIAAENKGRYEFVPN
ncbi:MAG: VWA domain-containing protein [Planctomycetota bacterium]